MNRRSTFCKSPLLVAGVALGLLLPAVRAAEPANDPVTAARPLEEVEIIGKKLYQLQREVIEAEERYYALYNELNTNDDYDVYCELRAPLGTKIKTRICTAAYIAKAQEAEAKAFLDGETVAPTAQVALMRQDDYRKSAIAVLKANPRLYQLLRERNELERKYERVRKERMKGHWILFE
jgi:hypothetical protein